MVVVLCGNETPIKSAYLKSSFEKNCFVEISKASQALASDFKVHCFLSDGPKSCSFLKSKNMVVREGPVNQKECSRFKQFNSPNFPATDEPLSRWYLQFCRENYYCFDDLELFDKRRVTPKLLVEQGYLNEVAEEVKEEVAKLAVSKLNSPAYNSNPQLFISKWIEERGEDNFRPIEDPAIYVCSRWTNDN